MNTNLTDLWDLFLCFNENTLDDYKMELHPDLSIEIRRISDKTHVVMLPSWDQAKVWLEGRLSG